MVADLLIATYPMLLGIMKHRTHLQPISFLVPGSVLDEGTELTPLSGEARKRARFDSTM